MPTVIIKCRKNKRHRALRFLREKPKLKKITGSSPIKNLHYHNNENIQVYLEHPNDNNITNINQIKSLQNHFQKLQPSMKWVWKDVTK